MKDFVIALVVLTLVHSVVSFAAYRLLVKRTVASSTVGPAVTKTTGDGSEITIQETLATTETVPTPVEYYVLFGYAGLLISAAMALYHWIRYSA